MCIFLVQLEKGIKKHKQNQWINFIPHVRCRIARQNNSASLLLSSRIMQFGAGQDIKEWVLETLSSWDPTDLSTNHTPQSVQLTYFRTAH
jgi:hypothetical protein